MIRIEKRPLPSDVITFKEDDYRSGIVFEMLTEDCHNKCYICEDFVHTAPNVEHRVPPEGNISLKYDWYNLLLACSHCNNIKSDKYKGIIDPTKTDPELYIQLTLGEDEELREKVIVQKTDGDDDVEITVDLLNAVYNGERTAMRRYACQHLKTKFFTNYCGSALKQMSIKNILMKNAS